MMKVLSVAALAGLLVLAAPLARAGQEDDAETPDPRIGEEVGSICFARTINGWKALKGVDDVVLLEKGVNDWYYVELQGHCPARVFRMAEQIAIESRPAGGCLARGDVIIVRDVGRFTSRCFVRNIRRWDDAAPAPEKKEDDEAENGRTPETTE